jgi:hypothetical protein
MMDAKKLNEAPQYEYDKEKDVGIDTTDSAFGEHPDIHRAEDVVKSNPLARSLQGRHMQMIAIGIRAVQLRRRLGFDVTHRWQYRCWSVRRLRSSPTRWWTGKLGM